jgi:hypothetical protein
MTRDYIPNPSEAIQRPMSKLWCCMCKDWRERKGGKSPAGLFRCALHVKETK